MSYERDICVENFTVAVCIISVLSQIPAIYNSSILSSVVNVVWILFLIILLYKDKFRIPFYKVIILPLMFDVWILICEVTHRLDGSYINSDLFIPVNMCAFIMVIGWLVGEYYCEELLEKLAKSYVFSTVVMSFIIAVQYFFGKAIQGNGYLYNGKNSAASIVLCSFIILVLMKNKILPQNSNILFLILVTYHLYILIYMQSRMGLLSLAFFLVWYLVFVEKRIWVRILIIAICCMCVYFVMTNSEAYSVIVENIILNGKDASDINAVTSNRMDHFKYFLEYFPDKILMGYGGYYLESFPLTALLSFGIFGGVILFVYMLEPIRLGFRIIRYGDNYLLAILLISVSLSLILNGIGEELPPYGPGVKCFLMWFLAGIAKQSEYYNTVENTL